MNSQAGDRDPSLSAKVERARSLRALILKHREQSDRERRLALPIVKALAEGGFFLALVPRVAGGEEWAWPTFMRIVEELATIDGPAAWVMGVGGGVNSVVSGWLTSDIAHTVFRGNPIGLSAGTFFKSGTARRVDGGYMLTGQWSFASGAPHAAWFMGGYHLDGPGDGRPADNMQALIVPARDVEIVDTWKVSGMRGTGSHDFRVDDIFVPSDYAVDPVNDTPCHPGPLYRLPFRVPLGSGLGPLALGMARGAIDCFTEVMAIKTDRRTGVRIGDRLTVQERLAQAEGAVRSARAFLYEVADDVWCTVSASTTLSDRQVALYHLANMNAVESGARAIDLVYHAAGMSGIYTASLLERFFRDIHVATQHRHASPAEMYQVGQVLLNQARTT